MNYKILALCLAIVPTLCAAQDNDICMRQFQAEQTRIERDMAQQQPAAGNREAQILWSKTLHDALALAATNAEQCRRQTSPKQTPAARASEQDCRARVRGAAEALQNRYQGKTLSASEQAALRTEEMRLNDEMNACNLVRRR